MAKRKAEASDLLPLGVVDHIRPFGTDETLRLDPANLRVLCKPCHDRATASTDGGFGNPVKGKQR